MLAEAGVPGVNASKQWSSCQAIQKIWPTVLNRACVQYRRPHRMRHTYASMMLSAGEHPMWVAQQMGLKDWAMIIRVYGRWMPSEDLDAGGKAVGLLETMLAKSWHFKAKTAQNAPNQ
ncbi:hypothetical protein CEY04_06045 [Achromobacter sp. HZ28]|nr:hypothetical protein CEY05_06055 [Achromobacter sp. HZ34]OWT81443.1 hypothetical protein CEY04_06045 [Achromobacter sp. HZ28]